MQHPLLHPLLKWHKRASQCHSHCNGSSLTKITKATVPEWCWYINNFYNLRWRCSLYKMNNVKDCRCFTGKIRFIKLLLWNRTALCQYLHLGGIVVPGKSSSKKQHKLLCKVAQPSSIRWAKFLGRAHQVKCGFALLRFNACRVKSWRTLRLYFELQLCGSWELQICSDVPVKLHALIKLCDFSCNKTCILLPSSLNVRH